MADPLFDLLLPYLEQEQDTDAAKHRPSLQDSATRSYLERLSTLSLKALTTTEDASLAHSSQSSLRSLQALSKRSHQSITTAATQLKDLPDLIQSVEAQAAAIESDVKTLENKASEMARKYERSTDNDVLDKRRTAALLNRNMDRIGNMMELPSLLASAVGTSSTGTANQAATTSGAALSGYASALDIHAHIRRLGVLYPNSELVSVLLEEADREMSNLISILISTLQSSTLKLAVAMRTIGWLRRVAPELASQGRAQTRKGDSSASVYQGSEEGALGALFLVCRLSTLRRTLDALEPLKQLADNELEARQSSTQGRPKQRGDGVQSERYLKRYVEIFREQSFAIVSMFRGIFPAALPVPGTTGEGGKDTSVPAASSLGKGSVTEGSPSALAAFVPQLIEMLASTLRLYMPNVSDRSSRDSLLSQVLFCAGSLGRLGADFSMILALIEEDAGEGEDEWAEVMKKHRVQASRLEILASGVTSGRKSSTVLTADGSPRAASISAK